MGKYLKRIFLAGLTVFLIVWGCALIKCEILTARYGGDYVYACENNGFLKPGMEYIKVLSRDEERAQVYYVTENMTTGSAVMFEMRDGQWVVTGFDTVWSDSGSASDVIWPYWWHFIYGGI